jgi:hypothetical protein
MDEQLFPQQPVPPPARAPPPAIAPMAGQITALATRLKLIEERYANLGKRNQLTEGGLLAFERDAKTELRVLTQQLMEMRKRINEINSKLDAISGELGSVVRKHEFTVLEKYMDLWQPMSFISRDEARRMLLDADAERTSAERGAQIEQTTTDTATMPPATPPPATATPKSGARSDRGGA